MFLPRGHPGNKNGYTERTRGAKDCHEQGAGHLSRSWHAGGSCRASADPTTTARAVPIYATTSFVFHDTDHAARLFGLQEFGNIYTRLMNPTTDVLEKRLAALDGGAARLGAGQRLGGHHRGLADHRTFRPEFHLGDELVRRNLGVVPTNICEARRRGAILRSRRPESIEKLIDGKTRAVYIEAPGNPKNDVPDFEKIAGIAHRHGLPAIVDNTVLTPALFRPIEHGFDIVVYSTTKFIAGHGVHLGGAIVDSGRFRGPRSRGSGRSSPSPIRPITV